MGKEYRLEDDLMKKSRPKWGSKRWNRLYLAGGHGVTRCEKCKKSLFNPQSILIHQGNCCQEKISNQLKSTNMADTNEGMRPMTFGEKLVGLTFNPSGDEKVTRAKQLCADLMDLLNENVPVDPAGTNFLKDVLYKHTIGEILNAQMNAVKLLTLKY